jgi:hypothetical protein
MVRINKESIFEKVDLDDPDAIRRIMVALHYSLTNRVLNASAPEERALRGEERFPEQGVVWTILSRSRTESNYPLLLKATLRFIEARDGDGNEVMAAAREMETWAPGMVLTVPQAFPQEYAAAEAHFDKTTGFSATEETIRQQVYLP